MGAIALSYGRAELAGDPDAAIIPEGPYAVPRYAA
jgi:hypothetical protein